MMIDCKSAVENLYSFLDRELEDSEYAEVQRHLDACPPCARFFNFEAGLLTTVGDCCRAEKAPDELIEKILAVQENQVI